MASILIVAHQPLASALLSVAAHAYTDCGRRVAAADIPSDADIDEASLQVSEAIGRLADPDVLVLVDAYGATPFNAALAAVGSRPAALITGVNVAMLWRTLCYLHLPFAELVSRALDGGRGGIMQVTVPPVPTLLLPTDASNPNQDQ